MFGRMALHWSWPYCRQQDVPPPNDQKITLCDPPSPETTIHLGAAQRDWPTSPMPGHHPRAKQKSMQRRRKKPLNDRQKIRSKNTRRRVYVFIFGPLATEFSERSLKLSEISFDRAWLSVMVEVVATAPIISDCSVFLCFCLCWD